MHPVPPAPPLNATVRHAVRGMARMWPLTVTQDHGERLAPDGTRKAGQQLHLRCAHGDCRQSVFCAGNDSGSYTWVLHRDVEPAIVAHLLQCHRAELGLDTAEAV